MVYKYKKYRISKCFERKSIVFYPDARTQNLQLCIRRHQSSAYSTSVQTSVPGQVAVHLPKHKVKQTPHYKGF